jgi:hypothetical protein
MPTGGGGKNNGEFSGTACIGGLVKFCDVGQAFSQPGSASASMPWHHRSAPFAAARAPAYCSGPIMVASTA